MKVLVTDVEIGAWVAHTSLGFVEVEQRIILPTGDIELWFKAVTRQAYAIITYVPTATVEVMK